MKKLIFILCFVFAVFQSGLPQTWVQKLSGISMWSLAKDRYGNLYAGASGTVKNLYKSTSAGENWDPVITGSPANFNYIACDSFHNVFAANGSNGLMKSTDSGLNWTNIPGSVFQGKTVQAVICGKNGYVYVGTVTGGLFRSTDYGVTFPDTALSGLTIVSLAVERYNSNVIYVGVSSASPSNTGFYRSTDAGLTFGPNLNAINIWGILEKANGNLYTITTSTGYPFSKSTDGGLNWSTVSNLSGAMRGACLDNAENIYTSGNGGIFKSTNDGVSFANSGLTFSCNQSITYLNKVFVCGSGTSNGGVWIYTDTTLTGIAGSGGEIPPSFRLYQNYPNPFNPSTRIKFDVSNDITSGYRSGISVLLKVFDITGKEIAVLVDGFLSPGSYEVQFPPSGLTGITSGIYIYTITAGKFSESKRMILIK